MLQLSLGYDVTFLCKTYYITTMILFLLNLSHTQNHNFSLMKCAITHLQKVFCTQFMGIFIMNLHTKLQIATYKQSILYIKLAYFMFLNHASRKWQVETDNCRVPCHHTKSTLVTNRSHQKYFQCCTRLFTQLQSSIQKYRDTW